MSGSNSSPRAADAPEQPLGLTVHSLPQPQDVAEADAHRTSRGRMWMLLVALICAAPVVASYLSYYVFQPTQHRAYGDLIQPLRPLPQVRGTDLQGRAVPLPSLKGQWLLVSVATGDCDARCEQHLYLQRQLREGLGKDKDRLDWVWLVPKGAPVRDTLRPAVQAATVLSVDGAALAQWLAPAPGQQLADHLYVVDPMGHWMMRFPADLDVSTASKARRDLERLLRASASWDQAGR